MSCSVCNDFQGFPKRSEMAPAWKRNRHWRRLEIRWEAFLSSAQTCHTCSVLLAGCRGCLGQHGIDETDILHCNIDFAYPCQPEWEEIESGGELQPSVDKEIELFLKGGKKFEIEIFTVDRKDGAYYWPGCWEIVPETQRTSARTSSDAALQIAQEWVAECVGSSHASCESPECPQLPTRVVSVGGNDSDKVYLVESARKPGKYVCLSHCWGRKQIITTTKSSIRDHVTAGIPLSQLSNTFRQAVLFTRRLGIQYIWIDSLCIIQDDARDWEMESARMAEIYSNGYLTLAATHSADGDGGLYCETPDFQVAGATHDGDDYCLLFRRRIDHHIDCTGDPDHYPLETKGHATGSFHPLLTRAWVYQERMLSTRVLHFGPYEIFFECRTKVQCECGNIGWQGTSDETPVALTKLLHTDALTMGFANMERRPRDVDNPQWNQRRYIARLWRTMVATYTSLNITKASDRLPAIGGLARDISRRRTKSRYLAGLWSKSLTIDLMWQAHGASAHRRSRPHPPSAPTWSWASVDCPVTFGDEILAWDPECDVMFEEIYPRQSLCKVERWEVTPEGVDEYGHISRGLLEVTGLVVEGVLGRETIQLNGSDIFVYHVTLEGRNFRIVEDYCFSSDSTARLLPGEKVVSLQMSLVQERNKASLMSLVLRRCGNDRNMAKEYNRIGALTIDLKPEDLGRTPELFPTASKQTITIV